MAEDVTYRETAAVPRVSGATADDWAVQATEAIVKVVGTAHDKITGPVLRLVKYVIYGLLALVLGGALGIMAIQGSFRLANNYLPDSVFGEDHMWAVYLIDGVVLILFGLWLWTKRKPRQAD